MATIPLNLREAVYALSESLDLVGIDDRGHGKRVAYMARRCGHVLGMPEGELDDLLVRGLVHDVGVSSTQMRERLYSTVAPRDVERHCDIGYRLLADCPPLARHAQVVRYHHAPWDRLAGTALDAASRRHANLLYLADRADALVHQRRARSPLQAADAVRQTLCARDTGQFGPEIVAAFLEASTSEDFWLDLEQPSLDGWLLRWAGRGEMEDLDEPTLLGLAGLFAACVDAKSPYTAEHSRGVARLARALGEWMGLDRAQCLRLEVAGLLHDLGKLRVPDEILDKPGPLSPAERAIIDRHAYDSCRILGHVSGLEDVAEWTCHHHERLDGSGYPFGHRGRQLAVPARIIMVADMFQALGQERPYRRAFTPEHTAGILRLMAGEGELDRYVVDLLESRLQECWMLAQGVESASDPASDAA